MKTLLIIWLSITNGVAADTVKSMDMQSMVDCEQYGQAMLKDERVQSYICIERN